MGDCCASTSKCLLVIINTPITLAGLVMLVAGGAFKINEKMDLFPELDEYSQSVNNVVIPMLILGAIFLLIGFLGCVGACTEKSWLLKPYFFLVFLIVIAQIAIIIVGVVKKDDVKKSAKEAGEDILTRYKGKYVTENGDELTNEEALAVNTFQKVMECCGYENGPAWWKTATSTSVPPGCCSGWKYDDNFAITSENALVDNCDNTGDMSTIGCSEAIDNILDEFGTVIIGAIAAIVLFEILCLAGACFIWKRSGEDNKFA